ncbi:MAG: glucosaminidase domain-containing protein, partial [Chitinophagaceae bacterium]
MMRFIHSVLIGLVVIFISQPLAAQKEQDILQYIATYKELAIREMQRTGVPAAIKLAQGIHETMAGKSDLVLRSNNHFGIKCKDTWKGDKVYHDDNAR